MKFLTSTTAIAILAFTDFTSAQSTTGACTGPNDRCAGDITYWGGGLGACGWNVDTNSQNEIALPFAFMGTPSNGNPYCGKAVTIVNPNTGNTAQATVGDKCMGCTDRSIDLTDTLFSQLTNGDMDAGREHNVQWWFTSA